MTLVCGAGAAVKSVGVGGGSFSNIHLKVTRTEKGGAFSNSHLMGTRNKDAVRTLSIGQE